MIQIQAHLIKPGYKNVYYMKEGGEPAEKISKDKWFKLHDKSWADDTIVVLPPITKERNVERINLKKIFQKK